jgi:dihydrolipoamide dehydrogenase
MSTVDYDLLVIGGGPGGYACAIRAGQLGLRTACIDERQTMGGTCLNVGCIPSKALLHATQLYHMAASGQLSVLGLKFSGAAVDLPALMRAKDETVAGLTRGIDFLLRKNGVTRLKGRAAFTTPHSVSYGSESVTAKTIVIATGSVPAQPPFCEIDNKAGRIVDSTGALSFPSVPQRLAVVGGGAIGLEMGSVWRRLGSEVTVIEYMDQILPGMDGDISRAMAKALVRQGLRICTSTGVTAIDVGVKDITLALQSREGKTAPRLSVDAVLVATGRKPNTSGLALDSGGLATDERGFIAVDHHCATAVPGIYAIGDVTPGPMLAHRAEDEGIAVAEWIAGLANRIDHAIIPSVVYTSPEAAGVGMTEQELTRSGLPYRKSVFPMSANSRAKANHETDGFVKILAHAETDVVLGAHIVASMAGTMIAQIAQAMEFAATSEDIAYTCHAHPTHNEAIKEAAMGIRASALHI